MDSAMASGNQDLAGPSQQVFIGFSGFTVFDHPLDDVVV